MTIAFTFDDIVLVSRGSGVRGGEVSLATDLGFTRLLVPILSAAMDTITEMEMQNKMAELGGLGIHHRYRIPEDELCRMSRYGPIAVAPSMGERFLWSLANTNPDALVKIDVANGESNRAIAYAQSAIEHGLNVISGNVTTLEAAIKYVAIGCKAICVGQGNGSACSTREVTGFGYPQASAILNMKPLKRAGIAIIADGGIGASKDLVKALALGADAVIIGGLLAGTSETPGEVEDGYKTYRGMASSEALEEAGKEVKPEGVSAKVPTKGSAENVINHLLNNARLAIGKYGGCRTIPEFQERAEFVRVSEAAYREGLPRI